MQSSRRRKKKFAKPAQVFIFLFVLTGIFMFYLKNTFFDKQYFISPLPALLKTQKTPIKKGNDTLQKELEKILKEKNISFLSISYSSESAYQVRLKNGSDAIFSPRKDLAKQASSLQLILSRFTIEGREFSRLDLRFENPVVVFK